MKGDHGLETAVRAHIAAGADWQRWLERGGSEQLRGLGAFFARERCALTFRRFLATGGRSGVPVARFETARTAAGTPYRFFVGWE